MKMFIAEIYIDVFAKYINEKDYFKYENASSHSIERQGWSACSFSSLCVLINHL